MQGAGWESVELGRTPNTCQQFSSFTTKAWLGGLAVFLAFMNLKAFLSLYLNLTLATENVLKGP